MTNRRTILTNQESAAPLPSGLKLVLTAGILAGTLVFPGCKKKAPPPPPPPPPVTKAAEPEWQLVSSGLELSPQVAIENALYVECSEAQMRASFLFIDALATGNAEALRSMLSPQMMPVLDNLLETDEWQESTEAIRSIELNACTGLPSDKVEITFTINSAGDPGTDSQTWIGSTRGSDIIFTAHYELEEELSADANVYISAARVKLGKKAFETGRCARCHGEKGKGTGRGPNLTDENWTHGNGSIRSILQILEDGIPRDDIRDDQFSREMPPATDRIDDEDEIRALAEYIWALSHPDQADGLDAELSDDNDKRSAPKGKGKGKNPPASPGGPG